MLIPGKIIAQLIPDSTDRELKENNGVGTSQDPAKWF